ncbi:MAG: hypothetical protein K0R59_2967 [Sphingobacterium sp.]|jgi:hypothetical protein|nr:hypothetical protein [Sphingobacterium sp.]
MERKKLLKLLMILVVVICFICILLNSADFVQGIEDGFSDAAR